MAGEKDFRSAAARRREEKIRAHNARQKEVDAARMERKAEFDARNLAAAAAAEPSREPPRFTNKGAVPVAVKVMPPPANKELPPPEPDATVTAEENTPAVTGTVRFASADAENRAAELGMGAEQFYRRRASNVGGYTVADVERIAGKLGLLPEDDGA